MLLVISFGFPLILFLRIFQLNTHAQVGWVTWVYLLIVFLGLRYVGTIVFVLSKLCVTSFEGNEELYSNTVSSVKLLNYLLFFDFSLSFDMCCHFMSWHHYYHLYYRSIILTKKVYNLLNTSTENKLNQILTILIIRR